MIVVFDSDVLIPMILQASRSARLFSRLITAGHEVALSPQILDEVTDKLLTKERLRAWLNVSEDTIKEYLRELPNACKMVPGNRQAHGAVPADPKDDMVIAAALEAGAAYIISEDKHLLDLNEHQGITIMNRIDFTSELDRLGVA